MDIAATTVIGWLMIGLIVGILGQSFTQGRRPMNWVASILTGMIGSLIGGFLGSLMRLHTEPHYTAGWLMGIAGAIIAVLLYNLGGRARHI